MSGGIFIGLGANLPSPSHGSPRNTVVAAVAALEAAGLVIRARSPLYESEPVPVSDQPWYVNAVVEADSALASTALLELLHSVENAFGRVRSVPNAPRILDLDLLDCRGEVRPGPGAPVLPHPRLEHRAFVLLPLVDIAPHWRHPVSGLPVADLIAALPPGQRIRRAG
ncbi:MAG TPA: 2-amino-4-hydroxy-6-hydroxymethyldihydropteridine diphosphokinase [Dongiaceae bacterium]|jgi:2-amino-4-hydroxy-6-hydroxymethyldihydropteridine diphosphokinase|nr:2-amino-4-hydroxy-6-hydroxymethyldihydropteridine diphosphokinase [Dongiaceae bacterium]